MNFIRHTLQPKMMIIWSRFVENLQSFHRIGVILILLPLFTLMVGNVLAGESFLPRIVSNVPTHPMTSSTNPAKDYSSIRPLLSGQIQLSAQSQISPTIESYPAPLSPTSYPAPPTPAAEGTEDPLDDFEGPYPEPSSREQPQLTYPAPATVQNPDIIQTRPSQDPSAPPSIGSNTSSNLDQEDQVLTQTSPAVSATILWIGFLASLIIFLSAILWSILTYSRQRNSEK